MFVEWFRGCEQCAGSTTLSNALDHVGYDTQAIYRRDGPRRQRLWLVGLQPVECIGKNGLEGQGCAGGSSGFMLPVSM
jgi:hypothetical protein